jgi:hypothetical protein
VTQENASPIETTVPPVDERVLARKYGIRELIWPDVDQLKALIHFLAGAVDSGKCGPVPKTAVVVMLEFLQGTLNRQNITKAPHMQPDEFDALEAPYYIAARTVSKLAREKHEEATAKGKVYQKTHITLYRFIGVLRALLDPASQWVRLKMLPEDVRDVMDVLRHFAELFPEQRRKGRAL